MPRTTPRPSLNAREFLPEKREHTHWPWLREPSGEGRLTDQLSPIQNNSWGVGRKFTVSWDLGFSILQCGTHPPKPGLWREDLLERRPMRVLRTQPVGVQSTKRKVTHQPFQHVLVRGGRGGGTAANFYHKRPDRKKFTFCGPRGQIENTT